MSPHSNQKQRETLALPPYILTMKLEDTDLHHQEWIDATFYKSLMEWRKASNMLVVIPVLLEVP